MKLPPRHFSTATRIICVIVLLLLPLLSVLQFDTAQAVGIDNRSLALEQSSTATTGASAPSDVGHGNSNGLADHHFTFDIATPANIRSILVQYCTTARFGTSCTGPTDLDANNTGGTTLGATVGLTGAAYSAHVNQPYVSMTADPAGTVEFTLDDVHNPSTANYTFYARISTYTTNDATGAEVETGTVAASTAQPIVLNGYMPESLVFCTGETVDVQAGGDKTVHNDGSLPDCTTATGGNPINFNQDFSSIDTAYATSQMSATTNANSGYIITVHGNTLESGANSIAAMTTTAAPTLSVAQFGMNLVANTVSGDAVGSDIDDTSNGAGAGNLRGAPHDDGAGADYGTVDQFVFNDGDIVAASDDNDPGTNYPTDAQIYTVTYIVNVSGSQPAGTYTTTLTYICTATY